MLQFVGCSNISVVNQKKIVGGWALESILYQETKSDGSIKERLYIEEEYFGPYFEFFSDGAYALFGHVQGKWRLTEGNRLYLEGGIEDGWMYTVIKITNSELIIEHYRSDTNTLQTFTFNKMK